MVTIAVEVGTANMKISEQPLHAVNRFGDEALWVREPWWQ